MVKLLSSPQAQEQTYGGRPRRISRFVEQFRALFSFSHAAHLRKVEDEN